MNKKLDLIKKIFHHSEKNYNCAQTLLKMFEKTHPLSEAEIETYRAHGGGRAPEGQCGALFAAKQLFSHHPEIIESMHQEFLTEIGDIKCFDIKKRLKKSCQECIACAATLVEKHEHKKDKHHD